MATDTRRLNSQFAAKFPAEFARILGEREIEEIRSVLVELPVEQQASIAARLPARKILALLDGAQTDVARWMADGRFEDAVALLSRVGRERRLALINGVGKEERKRRLLRSQQYPAHTVGTLVQDIGFHLLADARAADVAADFRAQGDTDPGALVVTDGAGRYVGMLDPWRLLATAQPEGSVRGYVNALAGIHPEMPIAAVASSPDWNASNWLAVIDSEQRVLGAVSRERVLEAAGPARDEGSRDILFDLLDELVHVAGAFTERMLRLPDRRQ